MVAVEEGGGAVLCDNKNKAFAYFIAFSVEMKRNERKSGNRIDVNALSARIECQISQADGNVFDASASDTTHADEVNK